jgi:hypothetical protein
MRRNFPPPPDLGPCPQEFWPVDIDENGVETQAMEDGEVVPKSPCPGRMHQMLNADGGVCDTCFFMRPSMKAKAPKPPGRLIEAPGRFRLKK